MEQQDYLKRQIDQIGRVLGKVLAGVIGLKNNGQLNDGIEITNQTLKSELDIDIYRLIQIPNEEFVDTLKSTKGFSNENLGKLAEILLIVAENRHVLDKNIYEKSLILFEYIDKEENVYSLDRQWKIEQIGQILKSN